MQVGAGGSRTVEAGSPACGEGAAGGPWVQAPPCSQLPHHPQIKVEEDFGFETDEALDSSWVSRGPDKLLPYPTLASPPFD